MVIYKFLLAMKKNSFCKKTLAQKPVFGTTDR